MNGKFYEQAGVAMTCRSYAEYVGMFALERMPAPEGPILDAAAGASSFVAEACALGVAARGADPLYGMEAGDIAAYGEREIEASTQKLAAIQEIYDWSYYGNLERHRAIREQSLRRFVEDYRQNGSSGRYVAARLPALPFEDGEFSLVLCSHFLFLYDEQFDYQFHLQAVRELLRVCRPGGQVRIYPLRSLKWAAYPHMDPLLSELRESGIGTAFISAGLPFIPGSHELLCLEKRLI